MHAEAAGVGTVAVQLARECGANGTPEQPGVDRHGSARREPRRIQEAARDWRPRAELTATWVSRGGRRTAIAAIAVRVRIGRARSEI